jgi:hypothetical protein
MSTPTNNGGRQASHVKRSGDQMDPIIKTEALPHSRRHGVGDRVAIRPWLSMVRQGQGAGRRRDGPGRIWHKEGGAPARGIREPVAMP